MQAITLTETGRGEHGRLVPWPWSVNVGGESHWLASRDEAIDLVANVLAEGRSNVDVGCFQLNYRWHGAAFAALSDMFDPAQNADYAADFLKRLHAQTGDWTDAVGAYHSSTPENAERYLARYATVLATFDPSLPQMAIPSARANGFPLLMAGAMGLGASLVPRTAARHRLIGD
ncbi:transglycosylase SLT domain-containing protein [Fertoeibacter niger]|nr:transglycosylase SLT domain-containing protein [Fertoeibacter niger]